MGEKLRLRGVARTHPRIVAPAARRQTVLPTASCCATVISHSVAGDGEKTLAAMEEIQISALFEFRAG